MVVVVQDRRPTVVVLNRQTVAEIAARGPQGERGPPGTPATGAGTDFPQSSALQWTINHNFGYRPSVELIDESGREFDAEIQHLSVNTVRVTFLAPTAGTARLT